MTCRLLLFAFCCFILPARAQDAPVTPAPAAPSAPAEAAPVPPPPTPTPVPTPDPLQVATPPDMAYVPGGPFIMGTDDRDREGPNVPRNVDDARPRHNVTLGPFYIDKTEVTNAQYKAFCDATQYPVPPHWKGGTYPTDKGNLPVTRVNWYEATAFAAWKGKRLPTEAEWEKAARGSDGRTYPWGDDWDSSRAVVEADELEVVDSRPTGASPFGALHMSGNAAEWTSSWYDAYPDAPVRFPDFGTRYKVVRGGPFLGSSSTARTHYRGVNLPQMRSDMVGFRCAQSPK